MVNDINMLRNIYKKLDSLPLGFGMPVYSDDIDDDTVRRYVGNDLRDALRESRYTINDIEENSYEEYQIETRSVYHALRRFRLSSSIFFKFSTAVDGKTVDKTSISKMINVILKEYDDEYKGWKGGKASGTWNRQSSLNWTPNDSGGY